MLLGGPEDMKGIKKCDYFRGRVINTPTTEGVEKELVMKLFLKL